MFLLCLILLTQVAPNEEALQAIGIAGESERTARRLAAVDQLLAAKQFPEAVQELQQILREAGDDLVPSWKSGEGPVQLDRRHCRQARWLCHQRLAVLPAEALEQYRVQLDAPARRWLEEGQTHRKPAPLRKLVEEMFASRHGDQALDLLGDLAFERGAFDEALHWWGLLSPPRSDPATLGFPDAKVERARVRAKQLLARIFQGENVAGSAAWEAFRKEHGDTEGQLAGRSGKYVTLLEAELSLAATDSPPDTWMTFAGSTARNGVSRAAAPRGIRWAPQPRWTVLPGTGEPAPVRKPLEALGLGAANALPVAGRTLSYRTAARLFAFHPLIVGPSAYWADARHVLALDLASGNTFRYELPGGTVAARTPEPDTAYTLTAADGRIFARLGSVPLKPPGDSFLVCLEPQPDQRRFRERWLVKAATLGPDAVFEGTPAVQHGRVFAAVTRVQGERARSVLCCLDADSGRLLWQQQVCDTDEFKQGNRRVRHQLVTCAGGLVVYCTHAGAMVAVDAATGRRAWAVRYPSRGPRGTDGQPSPRALTPCLAADEKLFVAPTDLGRILCLHLGTGQLLWESNPLETVHLLGVTEGKLLVTAATPYSCVRVLDAVSGRDAPGLLFPDEDASLVSLGRGVLADDAVLWPTNAGLLVLDRTTLRPRPDAPAARNTLCGNVVLSAAHLLVADRDVLAVYPRVGLR